MQHSAAFHQDLHCLLRLKQLSGTVIHHNLENSTCDPLKYTVGSPILIVSVCMGKSIRIQRVKYSQLYLTDNIFLAFLHTFLLQPILCYVTFDKFLYTFQLEEHSSVSCCKVVMCCDVICPFRLLTPSADYFKWNLQATGTKAFYLSILLKIFFRKKHIVPDQTASIRVFFCLCMLFLSEY